MGRGSARCWDVECIHVTSICHCVKSVKQKVDLYYSFPFALRLPIRKDIRAIHRNIKEDRHKIYVFEFSSRYNAQKLAHEL